MVFGCITKIVVVLVSTFTGPPYMAAVNTRQRIWARKSPSTDKEGNAEPCLLLVSIAWSLGLRTGMSSQWIDTRHQASSRIVTSTPSSFRVLTFTCVGSFHTYGVP